MSNRNGVSDVQLYAPTVRGARSIRDRPQIDAATVQRAKSEIRWHWSGFFPRSFVFSLDAWKDLPGLIDVPVPAGCLAVSPDYCWHIAINGTSFIALIGYCIDLRAPEMLETDVGGRLLDAALRDGAAAMLAETDELCGRYAAICCVNGKWIVFNDACAMRSIYYAEDAAVIASHSSIVGDLVGRLPRTQLFRHYHFGLPGNASPVAGVRAMPSNFVLDLQTAKLARFWPQAERTERPVHDLIDPIERIWVQTADAIAARWTPAISLTAGLDSRVTLAAFRHIPHSTFFTYDRGDLTRTDVDIALKVCRRLGVEHRRLPIVDQDSAPSIYAALREMRDYNHFRGVAATYVHEFPDERCIHVRSNLAEIGRARRLQGQLPTHFGPANWTDVVIAGTTRKEPLYREAVEYLKTEMSAFVDLLGYDLSNPYDAKLLGYDAWDLFYWEHRMSTWHAQVLLGSDFAFDTAIIFNSRRVLTLLLSAPREERRKATLFREFIARRCPELKDIPINPRGVRDWHLLLQQAYRRVRGRVGLVKSLDHALRGIQQ
jgi:hypothetical protein